MNFRDSKSPCRENSCTDIGSSRPSIYNRNRCLTAASDVAMTGLLVSINPMFARLFGASKTKLLSLVPSWVSASIKTASPASTMLAGTPRVKGVIYRAKLKLTNNVTVITRKNSWLTRFMAIEKTENF